MHDEQRLFKHYYHCRVCSRIVKHVPFIRFIVIGNLSLVVVKLNLNVIVLRYIIVILKMC